MVKQKRFRKVVEDDKGYLLIGIMFLLMFIISNFSIFELGIFPERWATHFTVGFMFSISLCGMTYFLITYFADRKVYLEELK